MTKEQMLSRLTARTGISDTALLESYLDDAGSAIINKAFPFTSDISEVPVKYHNRQIEIAVYLVNKRGAEGQEAHNENGINRTYESASVPPSMLRDIIPMAKIPGPEVSADENT